MKGECMEITFDSLGPGMHLGIPFDDYLKIKAFSKSMVGEMEKSPAHCKYRKDQPITTKSLSLGSLVDCMLLEPEEYAKTYIVAPATYINAKEEIKTWGYRAKYCVEWRDKQTGRGKTVITAKERDEAKAIVAGITGDISKKLLSGTTQVTALWFDPLHGVPCKARYDVLNDQDPADVNITDLKTTSSPATPESFKREMLKYKYHVQAAAYLESYEQIKGVEMKVFNFVVAETTPPYLSQSFTIRPDSIMLGQMQWERACGKYKECMDSGEWPGYPDTLIAIDVPAYALGPIETGFPEDIIIEETK